MHSGKRILSELTEIELPFYLAAVGDYAVWWKVNSCSKHYYFSSDWDYIVLQLTRPTNRVRIKLEEIEPISTLKFFKHKKRSYCSFLIRVRNSHPPLKNLFVLIPLDSNLLYKDIPPFYCFKELHGFISPKARKLLNMVNKKTNYFFLSSVQNIKLQHPYSFSTIISLKKRKK